ncbi:hypothetical protein EAS64_33620 [Trebonia kvetii]|uniref:Uncharacterized protein n=1 Tax=Trebonia kvetii TaxID=2480626 RepID=A0A6P2BQH6_9ACTN|nr:hypothetical protein [Trebonia kvetii]TVZ01220.1 hypothetical protein EAS64_33620 [Trebonia kvetii]
MAPPRSFDWDLLKRLAIEHPDWGIFQYGKALDNDNAEHGRPPVNLSSVKTVLSRKGPEWGYAPKAVVRYDEMAPPPGTLATEHKMHTLMRYLRDLAAADRGHEPDTASGRMLRQTSLTWREEMIADRRIVDLTADGQPIVREARSEELSAEGEPLSLMAWMIHGWRAA